MGTTDSAAMGSAVKDVKTAGRNRTASTSGLSGPVGIGAKNTPADVHKVSSALAANGLMDDSQTHADSMLYKGIIGAQERMDGMLKRDGIINPGGPTELTFSRLARQGFVKPAPDTSVKPAPRPATGDAVLNAELRAAEKHDAVATAEARTKANLSDETRSDFRKAQDRDRLEKARDDVERAEARARHEQAERTRRLTERRAAVVQKAAADTRKDAVAQQQRAAQSLAVLAEKAGAFLEETFAPVSRPTADPGSDDDAPVPDDPGQDDPEDPCAEYEQAVAGAEAEVEGLEARADKLEREITALANQVMELERQKQQIHERIQGMTAVFIGTKLHPDPVVGEFNRALGMSDEEFYHKREELLDELDRIQRTLDPVRDDMWEILVEQQNMNSKIVHARGRFAQAEANLRRCESR